MHEFVNDEQVVENDEGIGWECLYFLLDDQLFLIRYTLANCNINKVDPQEMGVRMLFDWEGGGSFLLIDSLFGLDKAIEGQFVNGKCIIVD